MTDDELITHYQHHPGYPVLDRPAAALSMRMQGQPGHAIAALDKATLHSTGETVTVMAVDHQSGQVAVWFDTGGRLVLTSGVELVVTDPHTHQSVPDDYLDGLSIDQARDAVTALVSDHGRYPQYTHDYFDTWVFGRARRAVKHRGQTILAPGQRCLARLRSEPGAPCHTEPTYTVVVTRAEPPFHPGRLVAVHASDITLEPHDREKATA